MVAATASASSATATSTTPFGAWTASGPIASGSKVPRPPPSIIAGPPMPSAVRLGGDDQVRAAGEHGVAGEAAAGDDRDPRHQPGEPRPEREGARVERRDDRVVGVPRAPAAALREQDRGEAQALDQLEHAVLLAMADRALGPGEHRVVVGEHRARRAFAVQVAVDPRRAGDQPVGGRAGDQLRGLAPGALRRDREAAVLDEAARVDEVGEVLARRAGTGCVAALDRLRARVVAG